MIMDKDYVSYCVYIPPKNDYNISIMRAKLLGQHVIKS